MIPAGWAHLPFFTRDWPRIEAALAGERMAVFPPRERIFAALDACAPEAVRVGEVVPLLRMRIGRIPPGNAHDGCFKMIEAGLLHEC